MIPKIFGAAALRVAWTLRLPILVVDLLTIIMRDITYILIGIFVSAIIISIYLGIKYETIIVPNWVL